MPGPRHWFKTGGTGNPDEKVVHALEGLPDREYKTMAEVMEAFGETH